jgi:hypothetical protein
VVLVEEPLLGELAVAGAALLQLQRRPELTRQQLVAVQQCRIAVVAVVVMIRMRELGDADMLVGLIARTVRVARTREALEAELSGDINRAVRLYNELENEHYEGVAGSEASVAELVSSATVCFA